MSSRVTACHCVGLACARVCMRVHFSVTPQFTSARHFDFTKNSSKWRSSGYKWQLQSIFARSNDQWVRRRTSRNRMCMSLNLAVKSSRTTISRNFRQIVTINNNIIFMPGMIRTYSNKKGAIIQSKLFSRKIVWLDMAKHNFTKNWTENITKQSSCIFRMNCFHIVEITEIYPTSKIFREINL